MIHVCVMFLDRFSSGWPPLAACRPQMSWMIVRFARCCLTWSQPTTPSTASFIPPKGPGWNSELKEALYFLFNVYWQGVYLYLDMFSVSCLPSFFFHSLFCYMCLRHWVQFQLCVLVILCSTVSGTLFCLQSTCAVRCGVGLWSS